MTFREAAIIMAFTGTCTLTGDNLKHFYKYVEELEGRPVPTHEIVWVVDKYKSSKILGDFMDICRGIEGTPNPEDLWERFKTADRKRKMWHSKYESEHRTVLHLTNMHVDDQKKLEQLSSRLTVLSGTAETSQNTVNALKNRIRDMDIAHKIKIEDIRIRYDAAVKGEKDAKEELQRRLQAALVENDILKNALGKKAAEKETGEVTDTNSVLPDGVRVD